MKKALDVISLVIYIGIRSVVVHRREGLSSNIVQRMTIEIVVSLQKTFVSITMVGQVLASLIISIVQIIEGIEWGVGKTFRRV